MSVQPDITISLVNTNNRELLLACLATLPAAARDITLETIVVDNASTDGSADAVREAYPDVEVVAREHRHGFGANHNEAIRRATGRYVLILNEDTELSEGCLDVLCRFMDQNPRVGAAGPRILNPDGTDQPSAFHFPSPGRVALTTLTLQRAGWIQSGGAKPRRVDWVCGAAILARRAALNAIGGFDEQLFIYSEDPDLCLRLLRRWLRDRLRADGVARAPRERDHQRRARAADLPDGAQPGPLRAQAPRPGRRAGGARPDRVRVRRPRGYRQGAADGARR